MWYCAPCSQTPPHGLPRQAKNTRIVPKRAGKHEVAAVLKRLRNIGLQLEFAPGANHWRVLDPGTGAFLTTVSSTPSDTNFWQQIRRAVERAGFSWEGRARKKIKKPSKLGDVSAVDLEALAHAQRMARIHGGREPQISDLEDKTFLAKVRKGFNEQETEEAIARMAQGVESARAHRVVSRLLHTVEQRGEEMAARARERNPKIRDGGVTHELMHISKGVAEKRGLRYWKTPESAWQTFTNLLSGTSGGMSTWVANLLEATMDEMDGLRWDASPSKPAESVIVVSTGDPDPLGVRTASPIIPLEEAENLVLDVLSTDWTPRADAHSTLVPEQMSNSRFEDAISSLVKAGRIQREREKKKRGQMLYQLAPAAPEPTVEPKPARVSLSQAESEEIVLAALKDTWTFRSDISEFAIGKGVAPRTFERSLSQLVSQGLAERKRLPDGKTQYRLGQPASVLSGDEGPLFITPEMLPDERSVPQIMTAGSIADRYADVLLSILGARLQNGAEDWQRMEPILTRLDRLAGVTEETS